MSRETTTGFDLAGPAGFDALKGQNMTFSNPTTTKDATQRASPFARQAATSPQKSTLALFVLPLSPFHRPWVPGGKEDMKHTNESTSTSPLRGDDPCVGSDLSTGDLHQGHFEGAIFDITRFEGATGSSLAAKSYGADAEFLTRSAILDTLYNPGLLRWERSPVELMPSLQRAADSIASVRSVHVTPTPAPNHTEGGKAIDPFMGSSVASNLFTGSVPRSSFSARSIDPGFDPLKGSVDYTHFGFERLPGIIDHNTPVATFTKHEAIDGKTMTGQQVPGVAVGENSAKQMAAAVRAPNTPPPGSMSVKTKRLTHASSSPTPAPVRASNSTAPIASGKAPLATKTQAHSHSGIPASEGMGKSVPAGEKTKAAAGRRKRSSSDAQTGNIKAAVPAKRSASHQCTEARKGPTPTHAWAGEAVVANAKRGPKKSQMRSNKHWRTAF